MPKSTTLFTRTLRNCHVRWRSESRIEKEITVKNQELANIEQIKKFTILEDQFRQDRDEIGPTMKVKRKVIEKRYTDIINAMYGE